MVICLNHSLGCVLCGCFGKDAYSGQRRINDANSLITNIRSQIRPEHGLMPITNVFPEESCLVLTTHKLDRASNSAFTLNPPCSLSTSRPEEYAKSTLGSKPTATTTWSVTIWKN
ncbi:hypothetical protein E2C01_004197 [Portunus trituberculatus]|uniref:Uncharacterized protein n=1 Tax=Portunus trituberculatus TaxID=210409 RepID=A0A5B7CPV1_PORTR|nr:hypothetical protein [Portunus trituberculatus]